MGVQAVELSRRGFILAASAALAMALRAPLKSSAQTTDTPPVRDSDEYSVYSAILNSQFTPTKLQQFVINGKTSRITNPAYFDRVAPDVEFDTISDFKAKSEKSGLLERRLDLKTPYVFVSEDELDALFNHKVGVLTDIGGWGRFYERYPGAPGLIAFSRVGFDSIKDQALVYIGFQHGYLGGSGRFLVLAKADRSWQVQKQVVIALF